MNHYAFAHFCDDVRFELGGKYTLVGLYGSELNIDVMPAILPKLCIVSFFVCDITSPPNSLSMKIFSSDGVLAEAVILSEQISQSAKDAAAAGTTEDPMTKVYFTTNTALSPFMIEKPSKLTVAFYADGEEVIAGKLRIRNPADHQM